MFTVLFFGDVVGSIGRRGIISVLPDLRDELVPDLVIANVENLAHGRGVTAKTLLELDAAGVDAYTSGNHVWENATGLPCFDDERWKNRLIRPANVDPALAGRGMMTLHLPNTNVVVMNLLGQLFLKENPSSPFLAFDRMMRDASGADIVLVDFHAEATSEKEAFGHYADGRATAVLGTHTHVPTADQKILPGGTAYVTDVGRNGALDSVIGFEKQSAVNAFVHPGQTAYDLPSSGKIEINAMCLKVDLDTKTVIALDRIRKIVDG